MADGGGFTGKFPSASPATRIAHVMAVYLIFIFFTAACFLSWFETCSGVWYPGPGGTLVTVVLVVSGFCGPTFRDP